MQTLTYVIIITVAAGLSLYTGLASFNDVPGDSVSAVLRRTSRDWWVLAFLWGLLAGHWFLGFRQALTTPTMDSVYLLILTALILFVNVLHFRFDWASLPVWGYGALLFAGALVGHFLWSQGGTHPLA